MVDRLFNVDPNSTESARPARQAPRTITGGRDKEASVHRALRATLDDGHKGLRPNSGPEIRGRKAFQRVRRMAVNFDVLPFCGEE